MWVINLHVESKSQTQRNREEAERWLPRGSRGGEGVGELRKGDQKVQTSSHKIDKSRDVTDSTLIRINNTLIYI